MKRKNIRRLCWDDAQRVLSGKLLKWRPVVPFSIALFRTWVSLQLVRFVKPAFETFIQPSARNADIIVPHAAVNDVGICRCTIIDDVILVLF